LVARVYSFANLSAFGSVKSTQKGAENLEVFLTKFLERQIKVTKKTRKMLEDEMAKDER